MGNFKDQLNEQINKMYMDREKIVKQIIKDLGLEKSCNDTYPLFEGKVLRHKIEFQAYTFVYYAYGTKRKEIKSYYYKEYLTNPEKIQSELIKLVNDCEEKSLINL